MLFVWITNDFSKTFYQKLWIWKDWNGSIVPSQRAETKRSWKVILVLAVTMRKHLTFQTVSGSFFASMQSGKSSFHKIWLMRVLLFWFLASFLLIHRQSFVRVQLAVIQSLTDICWKLVVAHGTDPAYDAAFVFRLSTDSLHVSFENVKFTARQIMQSKSAVCCLLSMRCYAIWSSTTEETEF